jgi:uncharacterized DUF497 family protein
MLRVLLPCGDRQAKTSCFARKTTLRRARHSSGQPRRWSTQLLFIVGHSTRGRLLLVCFTEREEGTSRIFAAWKATKKERSDYEGNGQSS